MIDLQRRRRGQAICRLDCCWRCSCADQVVFSREVKYTDENGEKASEIKLVYMKLTY